MNRMNEYMDKIDEKEQTCAIKDQYMFDKLGLIRDIVMNKNTKEYSL